MNKLLRLGVIEDSEEIEALEERLRVTLIPVKPRSEYVHELKRSLLKENELEVERPEPPHAQNFLLTAAGLLSGALLVVLGVRGVIALLNSRGVIQQLKCALQGKKAVPINPAL